MAKSIHKKATHYLGWHASTSHLLPPSTVNHKVSVIHPQNKRCFISYVNFSRNGLFHSKDTKNLNFNEPIAFKTGPCMRDISWQLWNQKQQAYTYSGHTIKANITLQTRYFCYVTILKEEHWWEWDHLRFDCWAILQMKYTWEISKTQLPLHNSISWIGNLRIMLLKTCQILMHFITNQIEKFFISWTCPQQDIVLIY